MNNTPWNKALDTLDPAERTWFQCWIGCGLTGHQPTTDDAMMPILFGSGSNGKTTLMTAITHVLGTYAHMGTHTPLEPNRTKKLKRLLTDLRDIRLCCLEEFSGGVIDGNAIKRLTASSRKPKYATHSIMVSASKLPRLNDHTDDVTRRLAVLPLRYHYVLDPKGPNERLADPNLLRELETPEAQEEILAWAVEGAQLYFTAGKRVLPPTPTMRAAKSEWLRG